MNVQAMRKSLPAPEPHLTPQDLVDRAASMRTLRNLPGAAKRNGSGASGAGGGESTKRSMTRDST